MSKNEIEWERYQARLKFQRDQQMYVQDAHDNGREVGLKEGVVDHIRFCQRLLKAPMSAREDLLSLPLADLHAKVAALEALPGVANR